MNDEITVKVHSYGNGRPLALVYFDPISGKKKNKSAGTYDRGEAERRAMLLQRSIRKHGRETQRRRPPRFLRGPCVYVFEATGLDCAKVGYSSTGKGVLERLRKTRTHCPVPVRLRKVLSVLDKDGEAEIHDYLDHLRINGRREWFGPVAEVLKIMAS